MSDVPDYLKATGLTWEAMTRPSDRGKTTTARIYLDAYMVDVIDPLTQTPGVWATRYQNGATTGAHRDGGTPETVMELIGSAMAELHVRALLTASVRGDDLPCPPLPDPLLAPFNIALRAQLPAQLAAQSRVTETLVSLGLALGMTSADLTTNTVEMT